MWPFACLNRSLSEFLKLSLSKRGLVQNLSCENEFCSVCVSMAPHFSSLLNRGLGQLRSGLLWEKFIVISKRFDVVIPPWIPSFCGLSVIPRKTWEPKVFFSSYFTPSLYFNHYSAFPSTYGKFVLAKRINLTLSFFTGWKGRQQDWRS